MTHQSTRAALVKAEARLEEFLSEFDLDAQGRILRYALDHVVPRMKSMSSPAGAVAEPVIVTLWIKPTKAGVYWKTEDPADDSWMPIDVPVTRPSPPAAAEPTPVAKGEPAEPLRDQLRRLGYSDTAINAMGDSTTMMQRAIDAATLLKKAQDDRDEADWIASKQPGERTRATPPTQDAAPVAEAEPSTLTNMRIYQLWDSFVGTPTPERPLNDMDKIAFARAVLAASLRAEPRPATTPPAEPALPPKTCIGDDSSHAWGYDDEDMRTYAEARVRAALAAVREPLTEETMRLACPIVRYGVEGLSNFMAGVRFAEASHGIGRSATTGEAS